MLTNLRNEISKVIIGQEGMVDALIIGLLCDGHILLEGVPGLAKTTTIKTFAKAINLEFKRVQFTPDLLPSDIVGMEIYNPKDSEFYIKHGPVFTNLLLADEINRSPSKVQAALLEAMQERQVTIGERSFTLEKPFLVLATQNPIESEGAYSLPEAQLDRFMMNVIISYNTKEEEKLIAKRVVNKEFEDVKQVLDKDKLEELKVKVDSIFIDDELMDYITDIVFMSRYPKEYGLEHLEDKIAFGSSPRGTIDLLKTAKAHAFLKGRDFIKPTDIIAMVKPVLRHRIIMSYEAQSINYTSDNLIDEILEKRYIP